MREQSKGKRRWALGALIAVFVCSMCMLPLTNRMVKAEGVVYNTLLEDGCDDIAAEYVANSANFLVDSNWNAYKREAFNPDYTSPAGVVSHVTLAAAGDIGGFDVRLVWSNAGMDGFNYAQLVNAGKVSVLVSDKADADFAEVPVTFTQGKAYEDGTNIEIICKNEQPLTEPGKRFLRVRIGEGGTVWDPMIDGITVFGNQVLALEDPCADLSKTHSHDEGIVHNAEIGLVRNDVAAMSLIYETANSIGSFQIDFSILEGKAAYDYAASIGAQTYSFQISVSATADGAYTELPLTYTDTNADFTTENGASYGVLRFQNAEALDPGMKYLKITMDAPVEPWRVAVANVRVYEAPEVPDVPVDSVSIDTEQTSFESGTSLTFTGSRLPENASYNTFSWAVYDDADCQVASEFARFEGNVLRADFTELSDRTVYVVATVGGVSSPSKQITVLKRPDASSVAISQPSATTLLEGQQLQLSATVLPAHANNIGVVWKVYDSIDCTRESEAAQIENGLLITKPLSGSQSVQVYVRAEVETKIVQGQVNSAALAITIEKAKLLMDDNCETLAYVNKQLTNLDDIVLKQGMINRLYPEDALPSSPQYSALGKASSRTDKPTFGVPSVYYKVYGDATSFSVSLAVYDQNKGALIPANKQYFGYLAEFYVSGDGVTWTNVPADYTASNNVNESLDSSVYTLLTFYNTSALPASTRYLRIDLIGQIGFNETAGGTEEAPTYTYSAYSGAPIGEDRYDEIAIFYNVYSPFLAGVKIFADKDTEIDSQTISLRVDGSGLQLRKGVPYTLNLYETLSTDPAGEVKVNDFTGVTYEVVSGGEYVEITDGSGIIKLKDSYNSAEAKQLKLIVKKGDAVSDVAVFSLIIPVSSVSISAQSATVRLGTYVQLSCVSLPDNATLRGVTWKIVEGEGGEITSDGRFRSRTQAGSFKIQAIVDGVESNIVTVTVEPATEVTENIPEKSVEVGKELELAVTVTPDSAKDLPVTWEIVEGKEFAALNGNVLTGVKEGIVKVRATVDGKSCEVVITVVAAAKEAGLSGGAIAGIAVGGAVVLGLAVFAVYWFAIRKKKTE